MLVCILLALVLMALIFPYVINAWLTYRMLRRLESVCRETGMRMRRLHRATWLVRNRSDRYDLLLEDNGRLLAIKLWSAGYTGNSLVITKQGQVYRLMRSALPMDIRRENRQLRAKSRAVSVPRTKLILPKGESRAVTRILLQYPAYREVLAETDNGWERLSSGGAVFDKLLYSPSALELLLREIGEAKRQQAESRESVKP